ncbi:MAG: hypothetical protein ACK4YP_09845 [Myxococcota bacterium]
MAPDAREDYGIIEAPNASVAVRLAAPIVRWDASRIEVTPCEHPKEWIGVADRVRYDALSRMSRSLLAPADRRYLAAMASKRPLRRRPIDGAAAPRVERPEVAPGRDG